VGGRGRVRAPRSTSSPTCASWTRRAPGSPPLPRQAAAGPAHYGVLDLSRSPELEESLYRICRAHQREERLAAPVSLLLERLLEGEAVSLARRPRPARAPRPADRGHPEPLPGGQRPRAGGALPARRAAAHRAGPQGGLRRGRARPPRPGRGRRPRRRAPRTSTGWSSAPSRSPRSSPSGWDGLGPAREAILEVLLRRFYRIRASTGSARRAWTASRSRCRATSARAQVATCSSPTRGAGLSAALDRMGRLAAPAPADRELVGDVFLLAPGGPRRPEANAAAVPRGPRRRRRSRARSAASWSRWPGRGACSTSPSARPGRGLRGGGALPRRPPDDGEAPAAAAPAALRPRAAARRSRTSTSCAGSRRATPATSDCSWWPRSATSRRFATPRDGWCSCPSSSGCSSSRWARSARVQTRRPPGQRIHGNRVILHVWPVLDVSDDDLHAFVARYAPATEGLGLEGVTIQGRVPSRGRRAARRGGLPREAPGAADRGAPRPAGGRPRSRRSRSTSRRWCGWPSAGSCTRTSSCGCSPPGATRPGASSPRRVRRARPRRRGPPRAGRPPARPEPGQRHRRRRSAASPRGTPRGWRGCSSSGTRAGSSARWPSPSAGASPPPSTSPGRCRARSTGSPSPPGPRSRRTAAPRTWTGSRSCCGGSSSSPRRAARSTWW
jgi:hypothetical protein